MSVPDASDVYEDFFSVSSRPTIPIAYITFERWYSLSGPGGDPTAGATQEDSITFPQLGQ